MKVLAFIGLLCLLTLGPLTLVLVKLFVCME